MRGKRPPPLISPTVGGNVNMKKEKKIGRKPKLILIERYGDGTTKTFINGKLQKDKKISSYTWDINDPDDCKRMEKRSVSAWWCM